VRVLALIPARGGSRGVPGKNLRPLGGRPLLAWSIEAAQPPTCQVDRVVVSSDSQEILDVAARYGAEPLERPAELATDEALTDPVIVHAVEALFVEGYLPDLVVLLQPTVPFRAPGLVDACIDRLLASGADSLLTGYPLHFVWRRNDQVWLPWQTLTPNRCRRQDQDAAERFFHEDGAVYVTRTAALMAHRARVCGRVELFETARSIDIDTEEDFRAAEARLMAQEVCA
jgi:CMP-N,N'-diacetyllegionaminic acid synthase